MITPQHLRAMQAELMKLSATAEYEGMTAPRWKQTLKDLPIVVAGSALGYGVGKTLGEVGGKAVSKDPKLQNALRKYGPLMGTALSSMGSYMLGKNRGLLAARRDDAESAARVAKLRTRGIE